MKVIKCYLIFFVDWESEAQCCSRLDSSISLEITRISRTVILSKIILKLFSYVNIHMMKILSVVYIYLVVYRK